MASHEATANGRTFGRGFALALALVVAVSLAAIPIAAHWNARGGEEWWTALVLGSAGAAFLRGVLALLRPGSRSWAGGMISGAVLGLVIVFVGFLVYFLGLHGS